MKPLIIIVLLIIVGVGGYWVYQQFTGQKPGAVTVPAGVQPVVNQESNTALNSGIQAEKGNFSKTGSLSVQEDGLLLVWGEPGNPAANVKLRFTQQSTCILSGEKKDCGILSKGEGNYYVSVDGDKSGDEVTVVKLEEQKLPQ